jgi:integrase
MKPKTIDDVKFYPLQRKDAETNLFPVDNIPVIAKFSYQGQRLEYNTGIRVNTHLNKKGESAWDSQKGRPARNTSHPGRTFSEVNSELDKIATAIIKIHEAYRLSGQLLPISAFRNELKKELGVERVCKDGIIDLFDIFIEKSGGSLKGWSDGLRKHFKVIRNQLDEVVGGMTIREIDSSVFEKYRDYLLGINTRNSTIENKLKRLKWFLRWTIKEGYIKGALKERIERHSVIMDKMKESDRIKQNIIYLTPDELKTIEAFEIPNSKAYLKRVRDCFLFSCYTALRHSDLKALKKTDIDWEKGFIKIMASKDSDLLTIPLTHKAKEILGAYWELPGANALPVITNEKANLYLKELGALVKLNRKVTKTYYIGREKKTDSFELWELLSTHVARRTFVTTAMELGIPADVVMSITGHSDYKIMQIYLGIRDERAKNEMEKFNNF